MDTLENKSFNHDIVEYVTFNNTTFQNCTFVGTVLLHVSYKDCNFNDCVFDFALISNCIFNKCIFTNCSFNNLLKFDVLTFENTDFNNCTFVKVNSNDCKFINSHFIVLKLFEVTFTNARFDTTQFVRATVTQTDWFDNCELTKSEFIGCTLSKNSFYNTFFVYTNFNRSNLMEVQFVGTFDSVSFKNANVRDCDFVRCIFTRTTDFTNAAIINCKFADIRTIYSLTVLGIGMVHYCPSLDVVWVGIPITFNECVTFFNEVTKNAPSRKSELKNAINYMKLCKKSNDEWLDL